MAQFVAFAPNVQVTGQVLLMTIEAMGERILPLMKKHGIRDVQPDHWYPQQRLLDLFRELAEGDFDSVFDLVGIGMKFPQLAFWPEGVRTIEAALFSIGEAYQMNHEGGEVGDFQAARTGERQIEITSRTPYPCDFDYGLIYNTARLYQPADGRVTVVHAEGECRKHGGERCVYVVSW